jgi:hypothetical protein
MSDLSSDVSCIRNLTLSAMVTPLDFMKFHSEVCVMRYHRTAQPARQIAAPEQVKRRVKHIHIYGAIPLA